MERFKFVTAHVLKLTTPVFPTNVIKFVPELHSKEELQHLSDVLKDAENHNGVVPAAFRIAGCSTNEAVVILCRIPCPMTMNDAEEGFKLEGLDFISACGYKAESKTIRIPESYLSRYKEAGRSRETDRAHIPFRKIVELFECADEWNPDIGMMNDARYGDRDGFVYGINRLCRIVCEDNPPLYASLSASELPVRMETLQDILNAVIRRRNKGRASGSKRQTARTVRFKNEEEAKNYILKHDYPQIVKDVAENTAVGFSSSANTLQYLTTLANLPWNCSLPVCSDVNRIRSVLAESHYGMDAVKERIAESIIVNGRSDKNSATVLCLVGAPGVGKTSIAAAIAKALGLPMIKLSMGGQNDILGIKGVHRSYRGSTCSTIISGMMRCRCDNPVILIDEIDKASLSKEGDPHAALLEVLDPSQNCEFMDAFLDIPFDISKATFICTANDFTRIPEPLRDRMEFVFLQPYSTDERTVIFERYVLPSKMKACGIAENELTLAGGTAGYIAEYFSCEGGVRSLERAAGVLCRKACMMLAEGKNHVTFTARDIDELLCDYRKPEFPEESLEPAVGVVNAVAVTSEGDGVIVPIECSVAPGTGNLDVTGNHREIARDSIEVALNYVKCHAEQFGIAPEFFRTHDVYVHYPRTYISNSGNSAGIANVTAIISAALGRAPKRRVTMTGEISLTGRVLEIGGLEKKITGAKSRGITRVIYPANNRAEADRLPDDVRDGIELLPVTNYTEVFQAAFDTEKEMTL